MQIQDALISSVQHHQIQFDDVLYVMTSLATCSGRTIVHVITSKHDFGKLFAIENGVYRRIVDYALIVGLGLIDIHLLNHLATVLAARTTTRTLNPYF